MIKTIKSIKSIVTAAGKGSRLYPISRSIPKELVTFCGIPVIEHCIDFLRENGITDITVIVGPKKGPILDFLCDGKLFGVNINYIVQDQPKGLGDAVLKADPYIENNEDFVLLLGDTIIMDDKVLTEMIYIHKKYNASSTILVQNVKDPEKYGVVKFDYNSNIPNQIIKLYEKPVDEKIKEEFKINDGWYTIAGLYILNKDIFKFLKITDKDNNGEIQLTDAIKLSLDDGKTIVGYKLKGKKIDVGGWGYLKDERDSYLNMNDEQLEQIILSRKNKMAILKK